MSVIRRASKFGTSVLPGILVFLAVGLMSYQYFYLGINLKDIAPRVSYFLESVIEFDGHGSPVEISMSLPEDIPGQKVGDESFQSQDLKFAIEQQPGDRQGIWSSEAITGKRRLTYAGTIFRTTQTFVIDSLLPTTQNLNGSIASYLMPDSAIQSEDPKIIRLSDSLGLSIDSTMLFNIRNIFKYVTHGLKYVRYSGTTDALTAYALGEASCGGKSRLMIALARQLGIPARLVGGKIMAAGQSRATHIWVELYIYGTWVPFCPTNNYFARIPENYLILYYGEKPLISHTKDINFKYFFHVKKRLVMPEHHVGMQGSVADWLDIWNIFQRSSISAELLRIILMLPFGVLVIIFFRNIVGVNTFGTFKPALIAIGFRDTGLAYGLLLFVMVTAFGTIVRSILDRLQLLHTPRLGVLLVTVITFLLAVAILGGSFGFSEFTRVTLFPLVILTLTIERFSVVADEFGYRESLKIMLTTLFVASIAFLVMSWRTLQIIVEAYPEIILLLVVLYIYVGRYRGLRLLELFRFKSILGNTR